jgi:ABC-type hemin transport system substrate-binding protein
MLSLLKTPHEGVQPESIVNRVRQIFQNGDVFAKAEKLVEKFRARAEAVADEVEPTALRELLYYLVDSVLDRKPVEPSEPAPLQLLQLSTP